jgi:hypothetical protein
MTLHKTMCRNDTKMIKKMQTTKQTTVLNASG